MKIDEKEYNNLKEENERLKKCVNIYKERLANLDFWADSIFKSANEKTWVMSAFQVKTKSIESGEEYDFYFLTKDQSSEFAQTHKEECAEIINQELIIIELPENKKS